MKTASQQYNMELSGAGLSPNSENKKTHPEFFFKFSQKYFSLNFVKCNFLALRLETFLYLGKQNFLAPRSKKFLYFLKKSFFYFLKNKKSIFLKYFFYFSKWKFLTLKKLIKRFYALNKFPLEETGCLSNHYFSLTVQVS